MVKTLGKTVGENDVCPPVGRSKKGSFFGLASPRLLPFEENSGLVTSVSGELGCQLGLNYSPKISGRCFQNLEKYMANKIYFILKTTT